ncbi:hypothetical protein FNF28_05236 [Cafeteria roenbergensis]|uniref:BTB domain-containing protein n=2 Tax=Cafeteria roenbergensis TaxID=33653 RepID=A0A5A8D9R8_CAFRO|nr:hypothetical protein FNF28_05236 [Cafeteria roenbergensis]
MVGAGASPGARRSPLSPSQRGNAREWTGIPVLARSRNPLRTCAPAPGRVAMAALDAATVDPCEASGSARSADCPQQRQERSDCRFPDAPVSALRLPTADSVRTGATLSRTTASKDSTEGDEDETSSSIAHQNGCGVPSYVTRSFSVAGEDAQVRDNTPRPAATRRNQGVQPPTAEEAAELTARLRAAQSDVVRLEETVAALKHALDAGGGTRRAPLPDALGVQLLRLCHLAEFTLPSRIRVPDPVSQVHSLLVKEGVAAVKAVLSFHTTRLQSWIGWNRGVPPAATAAAIRNVRSWVHEAVTQAASGSETVLTEVLQGVASDVSEQLDDVEKRAALLMRNARARLADLLNTKLRAEVEREAAELMAAPESPQLCGTDTHRSRGSSVPAIQAAGEGIARQAWNNVVRAPLEEAAAADCASMFGFTEREFWPCEPEDSELIDEAPGASGAGGSEDHVEAAQGDSCDAEEELDATFWFLRTDGAVPDEIVTLNVGGTAFTTTRSTLAAVPGSLLSRLADGAPVFPLRDSHGAFFIDRDPSQFHVVLDFLRAGRQACLLPDSRPALVRLAAEARYYELPSLAEEADAEVLRLAAKPISRGLVLQLLHSSSDGRLQLPATKLCGLVLSFLRLVDSTFTGCDFAGADLSGSDLGRCQATFASFAGANLTSATLAEARLERSVFRSATMVRANLAGADLRSADFTRCDLRRANLTAASVKGALWGGATLEKAVVIGVDLRGADMQGLVLREANFEGSDLSGAVLRGSDLSRANLWGCQGLESADLEGCLLAGAILPPGVREETRRGSTLAAGAGPGAADAEGASGSWTAQVPARSRATSTSAFRGREDGPAPRQGTAPQPRQRQREPEMPSPLSAMRDDPSTGARDFGGK